MVTAIQERFFFQHYGLTNQDLETYLAAALSAGGDYADLYFEYLTSTSLMVDESLVKSASQGISAGCGVRVVSGERTGYAYTDDLSPQRILHAARTAALIASAPAKTTVAGFQQKPLRRKIVGVGIPSAIAGNDAHAAARRNSLRGGFHQRLIHHQRSRGQVFEIKVGVVATRRKRRAQIILKILIRKTVVLEEETFLVGSHHIWMPLTLQTTRSAYLHYPMSGTVSV